MHESFPVCLLTLTLEYSNKGHMIECNERLPGFSKGFPTPRILKLLLLLQGKIPTEKNRWNYNAKHTHTHTISLSLSSFSLFYTTQKKNKKWKWKMENGKMEKKHVD